MAETVTEAAQKSGGGGAGAIIGVIIIVFMLALGGLYFWGAQLNRQAQPLPFIPGDTVSP